MDKVPLPKSVWLVLTASQYAACPALEQLSPGFCCRNQPTVRLEKTTIILLKTFFHILPEIFLLWLQCWVFVKAFIRYTLIAIVEKLAAVAVIVMDPINVVVHPI